MGVELNKLMIMDIRRNWPGLSLFLSGPSTYSFLKQVLLLMIYRQGLYPKTESSRCQQQIHIYPFVRLNLVSEVKKQIHHQASSYKFLLALRKSWDFRQKVTRLLPIQAYWRWKRLRKPTLVCECYTWWHTHKKEPWKHHCQPASNTIGQYRQSHSVIHRKYVGWGRSPTLPHAKFT